VPVGDRRSCSDVCRLNEASRGGPACLDRVAVERGEEAGDRAGTEEKNADDSGGSVERLRADRAADCR
jgi:hypothetical protein